MKGKFMKKEKGITLIALVITIIVLLILAGVAISMLSGENGILTRASEAKTKNEEANLSEQVKIAVLGAMTNKNAEIEESELIDELVRQGIKAENIINYGNGEYLVIKGTEKVTINNKGNAESEEEISDIDIELQKYFNEKELPYKCKYGYITGFEYDEEQSHTVETVAEVEAKLPEGYKIVSKYNDSTKEDEIITDEEKNTTYIATGMAVQKNGQEIARTIVFGDVNGDGSLESKDSSKMKQCIYIKTKNLKFKDYQKVAMDVNHDGELNEIDNCLISKYLAGWDVYIKQQYSAGKNLRGLYTRLQQYISLLDKEKTGYKFEYNEENDTYKLKGVPKDTAEETIISNLPDTYEVSIENDTIILKYEYYVDEEYGIQSVEVDFASIEYETDI